MISIDLLKSTLISYAKEHEKARNCAWLRNAYGSNFEAMDFLAKLLLFEFWFLFYAKLKCIRFSCANGWDYASEGLQELGFAFLETHLPKVTIVNGKIYSECSNKVAHTACRWGEMIILQCFKLIYRFLELLSQFVLHGIASIVESSEKILQRFDDLLVLSSDVAAPFLKSIVPVLKLKPKMREKLVDVLRKAMFHKDIDARKTAVSGFLLFLKYFNVMDVLSGRSQSQSQSFPTFSSQAIASTSVVDSEKSLERLCLEVVCCLRKAFTLQSEVRKLLYTGLCSSVRKNVQLLPAVIDLLDRQLVPYLENDEEKLPPIFIRKCISSSSKENVCLTEPLVKMTANVTDNVLVDLANAVIEIQERHSKLSEVLHEKCVIGATKKTTNVGQSKVDETNLKHNLKKCEHKVMVRLSSLVPFLEKLALSNKTLNADEEAWQIIRTNVDFIRWIFSILQGSVLELKSSFAGGLELFQNLSALTKILYYLHIQHDQIDIELKRAKMMFLNEKSLEISSHVIELVCCHFKDNLEEYFNCFLDNSSENLRGKLFKIIQTFVRLLSRVLVGSASEESSDNKASFKVALPLIRIIDFLLKLAPDIGKECSPISKSCHYDQVYNALWQICTNQHLTDTAVGKSLWTMLIRMQVGLKEVPKEIIVVAQNLLKVYGAYKESDIIPSR
uniref:Uncharacterized protein n=1 Tax=Romanomermis culicivorax TaxID=13658 RepID=A0A915IKM3_ROMCU